MADGDIIGPIDSFAPAFPAQSLSGNICPVSGDVFAASMDGAVVHYLCTLRINTTTGIITHGLLDHCDLIDNPNWNCEIFHISGDVFGVLYGTGFLWHIRTYHISPTGMITAIGYSNGATAASVSNYNPPVLVNGNVFMFTLQEGPVLLVGIGVRTITILPNGTIGAVSPRSFFVYDSNLYHSVVRVNTSPNIFAVTLSANAVRDTQILTFSVTDAGVIGAEIGRISLDTVSPNWATPQLVNISGNIWACFYSNALGRLAVQTFVINPDGTFGAVIQTVDFGASVPVMRLGSNFVNKTGANIYTLVYSPAAGPNVVNAISITISDAGTIGAVTSGPTLILAQNLREMGNTFYLGNNKYVFASDRGGQDEWVATYEVTTWAGPPAPVPTITNRNLAYALGRRNV